MRFLTLVLAVVMLPVMLPADESGFNATGAGFTIVPITAGGGSTPDPSPTYLVEENFEGTGIPTGWTNASEGTIQYDYTTNVLEGTQSLYMNDNGTDAIVAIPFTTSGTVYGYFECNILVNAANVTIVRLMNGGTTCARIYAMSGNNFRVQTATTTADVSTDFNKGVTTHVWWKYSKGGANESMEIWFSEDGTKPADASAYYAKAEEATNNRDVTYMRLYSENAGTHIVFDKIRVDDEDIGSNPP